MNDSWGVFKGVYRGDGIYWSGTYNVEGRGDFETIAACHQFIDDKILKADTAKDEDGKAKIELGRGIGVKREGDNVRIFFPEGERQMTIRQYRQTVFEMEEQLGKEFVWL
jgi:hypothetical protein